MRNYIKDARFYLANSDSRLTEFWFGIQALGTSSLSLLFTWKYIGVEAVILLSLNAIFAIPQIVFSLSEKIVLRHWSNWITSVFSFMVSVSMINQSIEQISVFGYAFLGIATAHCAFLTNRQLHGQNFKNEHKIDNE